MVRVIELGSLLRRKAYNIDNRDWDYRTALRSLFGNIFIHNANSLCFAHIWFCLTHILLERTGHYFIERYNEVTLTISNILPKLILHLNRFF